MKSRSKRIVLPVHVGNDFAAAPDYFVIEIAPAYARTLLGRLRLVRKLHRRDRDVFKTTWWDYSGAYFAGDPEEHDEALEPARMECNQLVVSDDIIWKAIVKHTDVYASTDPLTEKDLLRLARRAA